MISQSNKSKDSALEAPTPTLHNVCAVVVTYFPDAEFENRLKVILPQVAKVVIVDNTPNGDPSLLNRMSCQTDQIHYIINQVNHGVATALNQGLEYALQHGFPWLLTLDQDTGCHRDMLTILGVTYEGCHPRPAVIGSNYLDPLNHRLKILVPIGVTSVEQKTVITSGSLINTALASGVGGFRDDYFIDQLDHEFCLRMRAHGHKVVISGQPAMTHSVGLPGGAVIPFLGVLPNHPPVRKYYIARNTVVTVIAYWRREPAWCLRRLGRLLLGLGEMALLEDQGFSKARAFFGGVADGLRGRMGPCTRESLDHSTRGAS